jgi:SAM-dependent methyltransferase
MPDPSATRVVGLYADRAADWIADRRRTPGEDGPGLSEAGWLDRFMAALPPGGSVLDAGCGSGWPMAAALIGRGFRVTGVDASPGLIAHAAETLPEGEWRLGDMRTLDLAPRRFDGLMAWHSLFHLTPDDQRTALPRILSHAAPACVFLTSTGPAEGEVVGDWRGEPLYHGSLAPEDYRALFAAAGFVPDPVDPAEQDGHGLRWLARRGA